jgi:dTDP-4-dehydrorhamnose 3,5-epimerase
MVSDLIKGVEIKNLVTHTDQRGFFREVIRVTDNFFEEGFGQWAHTIMHAGVAKAWHVHQLQVDWWYVMGGVLKVVLHDLRPDSPTYQLFNDFLMGDNQPPIVVKIPPGVAHGCKALTEVQMSYITSRVYDPNDEGRLSHDDPMIGYDWLRGPDIK